MIGKQKAKMSHLTELVLATLFTQLYAQTCAPSVDFVTRAGWSAQSPVGTTALTAPVSRVFISHTAGARCYNSASCTSLVQSIQNTHMVTLGWWDIGYNFLVGEDGNVYEGRGWNNQGAHTKYYNSDSYGITVLGDFTSDKPDNIALQALKNLIQCGIDEGKISSTYKLYGHRDAVCTQSPGDVLYGIIQGWDNYANEQMSQACPPSNPPPGDCTGGTGPPTLSQQCRDCICQTEGCWNYVGECYWDVNSDSCGPFAMKLPYWCDAFYRSPCNSALDDEWRSCARDYTCSAEALNRYMCRYGQYCVGSGNTPTCQDFARIHNGGPNGCNNANTLGYWSVVEACCTANGGC